MRSGRSSSATSANTLPATLNTDRPGVNGNSSLVPGSSRQRPCSSSAVSTTGRLRRAVNVQLAGLAQALRRARQARPHHGVLREPQLEPVAGLVALRRVQVRGGDRLVLAVAQALLDQQLATVAGRRYDAGQTHEPARNRRVVTGLQRDLQLGGLIAARRLPARCRTARSRVSAPASTWLLRGRPATGRGVGGRRDHANDARHALAPGTAVSVAVVAELADRVERLGGGPGVAGRVRRVVEAA